MDQLIALDKELFFILNGLHTLWLDIIMESMSKTLVWIPLYLFLLYQIIKEHKTRSWIVLLGVGLTILLTDQTTSSFMKPFFGRLRPSHEPSLEGLIHLVNGYKGGVFGFASSHAANTFGLATYLTLLFKSTKPWMRWLFLWATLMSYTRIYLGVHYPGDIAAGAAVGVLCGWLSFLIYERFALIIAQRKIP
ncbi:MAG: phosphatase PAP2 family protein [Cyclobacteriaceae bacterium]|jgi:undecaprenyl-diphosphatase|nr:phosphatase PAP2 family protein [Cyclobacteriaceae bacterium]MDH4296066.1 phosphatase PAP2 family protein [Cyclobacteriaceae bacterium]MDH5247711.1 phosphatase PAP2 family protein [Cyclobacteriaceae bacterium]